jgi:membrane protease subunit HflK
MKNKTNMLSSVLSKLSRYFVALIILVILLLSFSGFRVIQSGNVALIMRFGKLVGNTYEEQIHEPGLLVAFPFLIDEVIIIPVDNVIEQSVTLHYSEGKMTGVKTDGYVITGDQNIALISASVKYTISNPVDYTINISNASEIINAFVSSAMVDVSSNMSVDALMTSEQDSFAKKVASETQGKLDRIQSGISIATVELTKVSMPEEVKETYDKVNSASVQAKTILEDAELYKSKTSEYANSIYDSLISRAKISYSNSVASANESLAEFYGILEEYETNAETVRTRVFADKITALLSKIGRVRVVNEGETKIFIKLEK